jgi:hypothetical protein
MPLNIRYWSLFFHRLECSAEAIGTVAVVEVRWGNMGLRIDQPDTST